MMFLKKIIPPFLLDMYRRRYFSGEYSSWESARKHSSGYDDDRILEKVKYAAREVKEGRASYERDSVLFKEPAYSWQLLAFLLWVASKNGNKLHVLDFGGSLGSLYFQHKNFFEHLDEFSWSIVEQDNFVQCGKTHFEDAILKFYSSVHECIKERNLSVVIFSSVLQYLENPYLVLRESFEQKIPYIFIDRTPFQEKRKKDILTTQRVPRKIYNASYPCWIFNTHTFLSFFEEYTQVAHFEDEDRMVFKDTKMWLGGYIFEKK